MGKTTEYLGLYEPYDSDFYDVDRDQNENFTILDNKAKEVDEAILSAKGYTDGLATSKTINSFPLSQATEGEVYRVPTTNKYVVCTKNYNGSQISLPNSNFEELSVWENRSKYSDTKKVSGEFRPNSTIPDWDKYYFHSFVLAIDSRGKHESGSYTLAGAEIIRWNDNALSAGSLLVVVDKTGLVKKTGYGANEYFPVCRDIMMWGRK